MISYISDLALWPSQHCLMQGRAWEGESFSEVIMGLSSQAMKKVIFTLLLIFPLLQGCGKPSAYVFQDERLQDEEVVKFCLTGDVGRKTPQQQMIADALEKENCDRIFFLGDLVYPKGVKSLDDPNLEERFLTYYRPMLERDPDLIMNLILGNHDHKGEPAVWKKLSEVHPGFFFPHYYYMIDYGGLCMLAVDTSFYYYTAKVLEMSEQTAWLTRLRSRLDDCDIKVALSHHPLKGDEHPGSKDWNGAKGPLKAFLETFIIGKFDMHITGHVHILHDDGKDEGTRLLISGTGGEILGGGRPGYIVLRWEPRNPKRIGYHFEYVDTEVSVYQDPSRPTDPVMQQQLEEEEDEYIIEKKRVEEDAWWSRVQRAIRAGFWNLLRHIRSLLT